MTRTDNRPYRCINKTCTRKSECEYGICNQRAVEIFGEDLEGLRKYGPRPMNPVAYNCPRLTPSQRKP